MHKQPQRSDFLSHTIKAYLITKHYFFMLIFIMGNLVANVQFYTEFGSQEFKDRCSLHLEKIKSDKSVYCISTTTNVSKDPVQVAMYEDALYITFRQDVIEFCSEAELFFFVASGSIAQQEVKKMSWYLPAKIVSMVGIPALAGTLSATAIAYKLVMPDMATFQNILRSSCGIFTGAMFGSCVGTSVVVSQQLNDKVEKTFGQTIVVNVVAPTIGVSMGILAAIPLIAKYRGHLIAKGDEPAAKLVGHEIALSALDKVRKLPRECGNLLEKYLLSYDKNYDQRYDNLVNLH